MQKEYTDDGLSSHMYTVSSLKAVRHRYILFVYGELGFFLGLQSGLKIIFWV